MKIIIDRFEGIHAVVELPDTSLITVPAVLFPGAHEGDVISVDIDVEQTKERKEKIEKLMKDVWVDE